MYSRMNPGRGDAGRPNLGGGQRLQLDRHGLIGAESKKMDYPQTEGNYIQFYPGPKSGGVGERNYGCYWNLLPQLQM